MSSAGSTYELIVVVLNYRTPAMVVDCLESLWPEVAERADRRVIVVDNCSPDDSADRIEEAIVDRGWSERVELFRSAENGGFAAGNNVGIRRGEAIGGGRHYLLLNSDTLVRRGALDAMVAAMDADETIGLLGCRLEWPDGRAQTSAFCNRNPLSELIAAAGTGPVTRALGRYDVPLPIADRAVNVEWVSFAGVMLRGAMLDEVGLLDEGYFMYFEDIDLCRRARQSGWRVVYDPSARVVHLRGGSSSVKSDSQARRRRPEYYYAARSRYFAKFYGRPMLWLTNGLWSVGRVISLVREWCGRARHVCEREGRDIWLWAWQPMKPWRPPTTSPQGSLLRESTGKPKAKSAAGPSGTAEDRMAEKSTT